VSLILSARTSTASAQQPELEPRQLLLVDTLARWANHIAYSALPKPLTSLPWSASTQQAIVKLSMDAMRGFKKLGWVAKTHEPIQQRTHT
jgi:hypothetical protein